MGPWDRLIRAAEAKQSEIVPLLRQLREVGCELEAQPSGKWRIRYGKAVASGRVTEAVMRDQWLRPNAEHLKAALALLEGDERTQHEAKEKLATPDIGAPLSTRDPLPQLADDHALWEVILREARARDRVIGSCMVNGRAYPVSLAVYFHGLRCAGVQIGVFAGRAGPFLRLLWAAACAPYRDDSGRWVHWTTPEAWRARFLDPYRDAIAEHLRHVMEVITRAGVPYTVRPAA